MRGYMEEEREKIRGGMPRGGLWRCRWEEGALRCRGGRGGAGGGGRGKWLGRREKKPGELR